MKRLLLSLLFLGSLFLLPTAEVQASHAAGGDITYEYIGDSTGIPYNYCITLTLYRREQGTSLSTSYNIDINSSCFNSLSVTVSQGAVSNFVQGSPPRGDTNCVDQSDPGYNDGKILVYKYKGCVVLPGKCSDFTFSWSLCCRNSNITNLQSPASYDLYLESKLNNTLGPNTSPSFLNPAAKFFCVGQPFTYSQAAVEPDQDSLLFTLANPWDGPGQPIAWASGYSRTQPIQTATGFHFNPANGLMTFTPLQAEVDVLKLVVEEYRYDSLYNAYLLVGTAIRELQIPILGSCSQIATTGVNIKQGENVGGVTSSTGIFDGDSLAAAYGLDSTTMAAGFSNPTTSGGLSEIDIIGYECYDSIVKIQVEGNLKCSSISNDGSEFRIIGPDSTMRPVVGVVKNCQTTLLTEEIYLILHKPLDIDGDYLLYTKPGNDGDIIENECGFGVKENYAIIIRVDNCPELDYKVENVSVIEDQVVEVTWWVSPSYFRPETEKLFTKWNILRANGDENFYILDALEEKSDINKRSYIDTSLEQYNLDMTQYQYQVQLVQNFDFRAPTDYVNTILLTDTLMTDSVGWELSWTEYNAWPQPMYEFFIGEKDTSTNQIDWTSQAGPDSTLFTAEFLIPDPMTSEDEGIYVVKVEATDGLDSSNTYVSQSNWLFYELTSIDPENPEPPEDVVAPNVFTPDGDGVNDIFYVNGKGYTEASIQVYNRWGKLVYETSESKAREVSQALPWDGSDMNSGEILSNGTYFYVLNLSDQVTGESESMSGTVNIFRN